MSGFHLYMSDKEKSNCVILHAHCHYLLDKQSGDCARAFVIYPAHHAQVVRKISADKIFFQNQLYSVAARS